MQQFAAAVGTSLAATIIAAAQSGARSLARGTAVGATNTLAVLVGLLVVEAVCVVWTTAPRRNVSR